MAFLAFNVIGAKAGDADCKTGFGSVMYQYQVFGDGAEVEFAGSNVPKPDPFNDSHWVPLVTIRAGETDTEPYRQYVWNSIRYKVISGSNVEIYMSAGGGS